jgi:hypothetical protein
MTGKPEVIPRDLIAQLLPHCRRIRRNRDVGKSQRFPPGQKKTEGNHAPAGSL